MNKILTIIICIISLSANGQEQVIKELDDKYSSYADLSLQICHLSSNYLFPALKTDKWTSSSDPVSLELVDERVGDQVEHLGSILK